MTTVGFFLLIFSFFVSIVASMWVFQMKTRMMFQSIFSRCSHNIHRNDYFVFVLDIWIIQAYNQIYYEINRITGITPVCSAGICVQCSLKPNICFELMYNNHNQIIILTFFTKNFTCLFFFIFLLLTSFRRQRIQRSRNKYNDTHSLFSNKVQFGIFVGKKIVSKNL